jgi:hypothetical protein
VRESVLDYVRLRRERGASANAIARNLMTYRNRVIVAPTGNYGSVAEVIMRKGIRFRFNFKGPKTNLTIQLRNEILHKGAVNFAILNIA